MNMFYALIAYVFCGGGCFTHNPPDGFRAASVYGDWYLNMWKIVNMPCYKGGGTFWKSISKKQMEQAVAITVGKFGNVIRPVFDRTLREVLASGLVKRSAKRGRPVGYPKREKAEKAEKAEKTSSASPQATFV